MGECEELDEGQGLRPSSRVSNPFILLERVGLGVVRINEELCEEKNTPREPSVSAFARLERQLSKVVLDKAILWEGSVPPVEV